MIGKFIQTSSQRTDVSCPFSLEFDMEQTWASERTYFHRKVLFSPDGGVEFDECERYRNKLMPYNWSGNRHQRKLLKEMIRRRREERHTKSASAKEVIQSIFTKLIRLSSCSEHLPSVAYMRWDVVEHAAATRNRIKRKKQSETNWIWIFTGKAIAHFPLSDFPIQFVYRILLCTYNRSTSYSLTRSLLCIGWIVPFPLRKTKMKMIQ